MEAAQKLPEPHGVVGIVVADPFLHQQIQQGNAQRPGRGQPVLGICAGGQNGVGDPVLVGLHLFQGQGQYLGQVIVLIGVLKILAQETAHGIKEICMDDNVPVLAGVAFFADEAVDILQVQKHHIPGVEDAGFTVEHMGDGAFEHIEDLIEFVPVDDVITVFCDL